MGHENANIVLETQRTDFGSKRISLVLFLYHWSLICTVCYQRVSSDTRSCRKLGVTDNCMAACNNHLHKVTRSLELSIISVHSNLTILCCFSPSCSDIYRLFLVVFFSSIIPIIASAVHPLSREPECCLAFFLYE